MSAAIALQKGKVNFPIGILDEHPAAAIAAVRYVIRNLRNYYSGQTCHYRKKVPTKMVGVNFFEGTVF